MRTIATALLAAATWTAVSAYDMDSCAAMPATLSLTVGDSMSCVTWDVTTGTQSAVPISVPDEVVTATQGLYVLQLFVYNLKAKKNDPTKPSWVLNPPSIPIDIIGNPPASGNFNLDGVNPTNASEPLTYGSGVFSSVTMGEKKIDNINTPIAYGYSGAVGRFQGSMYLIGHGKQAGSFPFAGETMQTAIFYRLVNTNNPSPALFFPSASTTPWDKAPMLSVGTPVTVKDAVLPGGSLQFKINHDFVKYGYSIQKLGLKVSFSVESSTPPLMKGNTTWGVSLPSGWSSPGIASVPTQADTKVITISGTSGTTTIKQPWQKVTNYQDSSITRTWTGLVDASSTSSAAASGSLGAVTVTATDLTGLAASNIGLGNGYDWSDASPFWDITAELVVVEEYPSLGSVSNLELKNRQISGEPIPDMSTPPAYAMYMVKVPLGAWRMRPTFANVVNLNSWSGNVAMGTTFEPFWDVQQVFTGLADSFSDQFSNNGAMGSFSGATYYDFAMSSSNLVQKTKYYVDTNMWDPSNRRPTAPTGLASATAIGEAAHALPGLFDSTISIFFIRVAVGGAVSGSSTVVPDHISIGQLGFTYDSYVADCQSFVDCVKDSKKYTDGAAKNSANPQGARFNKCHYVPTFMPGGEVAAKTQCIECTSTMDCGAGQYCHLDSTEGTRGPGGFYDQDPDSSKLNGVCVAKNLVDVLGKFCQTDGVFQGSVDDPTIASNFGSCGEYRFYNGSKDSIQTMNDAKQVRTALWQGVCIDNKCRECYGNSSVPGQICLNGRTWTRLDVDGSVNSFAQNTLAGTELGTTSMVILLMIFFCIHMYAENNKYKLSKGMGPLTCCEVLCCCGTCAFNKGAQGSATENPIKA